MKKFLVILVICFLWSNVGFTETIVKLPKDTSIK